MALKNGFTKYVISLYSIKFNLFYVLYNFNNYQLMHNRI